MRIVFDANIWIAKFDPKIRPPLDPSTGLPVEFAQKRIDALVEASEKAKDTLIIPTPVLSEVLVYSDSRRHEMLNLINKSAFIQVAPFDMKSAIELSELNVEASKQDNSFRIEAPYQKTKVDRQIAAICKVSDARLYTTDNSLSNFAKRFGVDVLHLADVPIPLSDSQPGLFDAD